MTSSREFAECGSHTPQALLLGQASSAVLYTPSSLCHVDFGAPAPGGSGKQRARRARVKPAEDIGTAGSNFRVLPLDNPCMLCAFTSPASALLVRQLSLRKT